MNPMPVKWNKRIDPSHCYGCGQPFKAGDKIYPRKMTGIVRVHYRRGCAEQYNKDDLNVKERMIHTHRTDTSCKEFVEEVRKTLIEWRKGEMEATDAVAHLSWEYTDKVGELG